MHGGGRVFEHNFNHDGRDGVGEPRSKPVASHPEPSYGLCELPLSPGSWGRSGPAGRAPLLSLPPLTVRVNFLSRSAGGSPAQSAARSLGCDSC